MQVLVANYRIYNPIQFTDDSLVGKPLPHNQELRDLLGELMPTLAVSKNYQGPRLRANVDNKSNR